MTMSNKYLHNCFCTLAVLNEKVFLETNLYKFLLNIANSYQIRQYKNLDTSQIFSKMSYFDGFYEVKYLYLSTSKCIYTCMPLWCTI